MPKVTFEFDDNDPDDRDRIRQFVHLDDVLAKLSDAYDSVRARRKYSEDLRDEEYDFLTELMCILSTDMCE